MFPVWFLSYRNKDRVAYATVNGQTGKVVADLPISVGKFLLGSLIAAIPVYILLCLLTVLTPGMTLTIVGVLAIIANICYSQELTMIAVKEAGTEDKGRIAKEQPEALGAINNRRRLKAAKKGHENHKEKDKHIVYSLLYTFYICHSICSCSVCNHCRYRRQLWQCRRQPDFICYFDHHIIYFFNQSLLKL